MMNFLKRLLLATFGAFVAAGIYGWLLVPAMFSTVFTVLPFLLLSMVAFIYLQKTGARLVASFAYLVGLFPFLFWIGSILFIFHDTPGLNDEMAGVLLTSYLASAAGGYLGLICSKKNETQEEINI